MAYLQNIPQPGDKLKDSQAEILANFQAIKTAFDQNHVNLDGSGSGNEGKHKFINLTNQTAIGSPASAADQMTMFERVPATAAFGANQQVYIVRDSSVTANTRYIPLTNGTTIITDAFSDAASANSHAFAFLGTGLCMKFGNTSLGGDLANNTQQNVLIPLDVTGPDFLAAAKYTSAQVTLCPENALNFGTNNTMVYIRWGTCTNTVLSVQVVNQTGAIMPGNTRIYYQVIGQVDLTTT